MGKKNRKSSALSHSFILLAPYKKVVSSFTMHKAREKILKGEKSRDTYTNKIENTIFVQSAAHFSIYIIVEKKMGEKNAKYSYKTNTCPMIYGDSRLYYTLFMS